MFSSRCFFICFTICRPVPQHPCRMSQVWRWERFNLLSKVNWLLTYKIRSLAAQQQSLGMGGSCGSGLATSDTIKASLLEQVFCVFMFCCQQDMKTQKTCSKSTLCMCVARAGVAPRPSGNPDWGLGALFVYFHGAMLSAVVSNTRSCTIRCKI